MNTLLSTQISHHAHSASFLAVRKTKPPTDQMKNHISWAVALTSALAISPCGHSVAAPPHPLKDINENIERFCAEEAARENRHHTDHFRHFPGSRGKAPGLRKRFRFAGASAGVPKGDFNGDGFADLALGVPSEDITVPFFQNPFGGGGGSITHQDAGAVNVIYGSSGGLTAPTAGFPASQFWTQESAGVLGSGAASDRFGTALASGNFNGDQFPDLAIAVPGEVTTVSGTSLRGAVQILYGSPNGLTAAGNQLINLSQLFATALAESRTLRVGNALVWGDFNGDGFGDLAVEGQNIGPDRARVSVLFGSNAGLNLGGKPRVEFVLQPRSQCAVLDGGQ
jgi:hypothetical protein